MDTEIIHTNYKHVMLCVIWYHLHNLKNVKNINGGVLLFVMLQGFTKNNIPPGVSLQVFKIIQMIPNRSNRLIWQRCCQNNDSCDAWKWYLFQAFMTHFLTLMCLGPLNFADVSIFLQKIRDFCSEKYLYSKQ